MLLSAAGGVTMAIANDLIVVFLGLEVLSIAVYVLAAMQRHRAESQEAGMKYFVLGAFSSAFFLYGIAFVYGATGSTNLSKIGTFLAENTLLDDGVLFLGLVLLLVGLGFKVAAVPFHPWTPDVYQGSPVTGRGLHGRRRSRSPASPRCCGSSSSPSTSGPWTGSPSSTCWPCSP